ncbi:two-component system sensor histidine kinase NtrB [Frigidibacter oleivorans]|uniref:two-component system sensor histidine kinase NtrB n=1 Tax=Frigidibacter oleivorans TaxID=2487129 RepID=UPI001F240F1D|nr:PAS domain S-box protein [Frigidibacter oleivorans]
MDSMPQPGGRGRFRARLDLLSVLPMLSILALVAAVAALVWVLRRDEAEATRVQLATDALWVEQTLRFQLSVDEDLLARLALDAADGTPDETLDSRTRLHIANNPELLSVGWFDAGGAVIRQIPGPDAGAAAPPAVLDLLGRLDQSSARPVYGAVQAGAGGPTVMLGVPVREGEGMIAATISLPLLLTRHVPWWIAERYAVTITDIGGAPLASRARMAAPGDARTHVISFDPPLGGTLLRIAPFAAARPLGDQLLQAAIVALSILALLALAALARSLNRGRRAEMRLRGEMAFRRSMEESLTVGLRAKDHEGRILYVNTAFCQLVGFGPGDLVGKPMPMPYWLPERLEDTMARQRALAAGGARPQSFETRFRRRDGAEIDVQVYEAPLIDAHGRHRGWMGSIIDITEARRAERLARAQEDSVTRTGRLVSLGEMASTLAHELNQPLAAVSGYAAGALNMLRAGQGDPAALTPALEKLAHQVDRAGQIIRRVQDLVRKREPHFEPLSLPDVVAETLGFMTADARQRRVRIVVEDDGTVPPVMADRILVEQLLVNLIRNAMEAMPEARRSGDRVTLRLSAREGAAEIRVMDQGGGIAPELADRLFEPFASTKADGMGMGLNICRSILELHRGRIGVEPAPGGGTCFVVTLPAAMGLGRAAE